MNYKKKANITLIVLSVVFIVLSVLMYQKINNNAVKLLFFIVEAALIGGMADWFAVTAIFKKPLGFPFHTAIIPKNRKKLQNSVVNIVEKEFLSAELISKRLEKVNISSKIISWIDSKQGREYIATSIIKVLTGLEDKDYDKINSFIKKQLIENTQNIDFNKYISDFLESAIRNGSYKKLIMMFIDDIITVVEGPTVRDKILTTIETMKAEKTKGILGALFSSMLQESNLVNVPEIADSIHMHLIETLYGLRNEENEDTKFLLAAIEEHLLINGIMTINRDVIETLKEQLVDGIMSVNIVKEISRGVVLYLESQMEDTTKRSYIDTKAVIPALEVAITNSKAKEIDLYRVLVCQLEKTWENIKSDNGFIDYVEKNLKDTINLLIQREHSVIGKIASDTLDSLSDDALNKFIEDRAGNDLQWIRINGSIVGGMVGALVFIFLTYFYDPVAVPFIRGLFGY